MRVRKWMRLALCTVLIAALFAGCGASSKSESAMMDMASPGAPMAAGSNTAGDYMVAETMAAAESLQEESSTQAAPPDNRKFIITVNMSAETEDMDVLMASVQTHIGELGGYVQDQRVSNGSRYSTYRYRNANLTVRIPAERVDEFTEKVSGIANVTHSSKSLEDITLNYVATESRVKALQVEEERLLELLAKAENMSDLLEIEARLTDVRYELENHSSQLRSYDNLVNYATIYLDIQEVKEYTPVEEETLWQRITGGFAKSLKGVGEGALDFLVWVVVNIPYLVVYGLIAFVGWKVFKRIRNKRPVKKAANPKAAPRKEEENKD